MGDEHTISAEEYARWVTPMQAMDLLRHLDWSTRINVIFQRLRYGHLKAIARRSNHDDTSAEFDSITMRLWGRAEPIIGHTDLWTTGDMTITFQSTGPSFNAVTKTLALFGVRFDPVGLAEFIPQFALKHTIALRNEVTILGIPKSVLEIIREAYPSETPLAPVTTDSSVATHRGRPPKELWDDLWVEMCRKIYLDGFAPKTQAEIERAMLDWATTNNHEMSESTAKRAARKLFPIFK